MDKQEHKEARLISYDLVPITPGLPDIQICFPPALQMKNVNLWGEIAEEKYHIMKVKDWLKNKKNIFAPPKGIASRYSINKVDDRFYGVLNIEIKKTK